MLASSREGVELRPASPPGITWEVKTKDMGSSLNESIVESSSKAKGIYLIFLVTFLILE